MLVNEYYKSYIPYCEKFGIKVATENMWQWDDVNKKIIDSVCSKPKEFCELIDVINSKWIVGCLDIGHAQLVGEDIGNFIRIPDNFPLQSRWFAGGLMI